MMPYVSDADATSPPPSVYEQDAVWEPIPSLSYGPLTALIVAANDELPSSASVTSQVAVGTDPLLYSAPSVTPATTTEGAVLGGGETLTVKVAGARSNVPPVLFEAWLTLIVDEPAWSGVTVSVCV